MNNRDHLFTVKNCTVFLDGIRQQSTWNIVNGRYTYFNKSGPRNPMSDPRNPGQAEQAPNKNTYLLNQKVAELWQCTAPVLRFKNHLSINLGGAGLMTSPTDTTMGNLKGTQSAGRGRGEPASGLAVPEAEADLRHAGRERSEPQGLNSYEAA